VYLSIALDLLTRQEGMLGEEVKVDLFR